MNDKSERIWKKSAVAQFKVLSRLSPVGNEENHENLVRIAGLGAEI
jgi:hypothetical protein